MAFTPLHTTIGIALTRIIPNPFVSLPLSILSHLPMDLYPEWYPSVSKIKSWWDFKHYRWQEWILMISQGLLFLWIVFFLIKERNLVFILGAFCANLIDLTEFIYAKIRKKKLWFVHGGWFPFKRNFSWQKFGMNSLQQASLDALFIILFINLI